MDIDEFWQLIDAARAAARPGTPFDRALVELLAARPEAEILAYEACFDRLHGDLYRWDVWAAAYLIGGGCSDDSFMDFRAGVIAEGRGWYEQVLAAPDALAGHPLAVGEDPEEAEELFYEEVNYTAAEAFGLRTGDEDRFHEEYRRHRAEHGIDGTPPADEDMGEDFDFDDDAEMHRRLPRLAAIYLTD
ncbi:DUF4240 domain-containing protein [Streptomyces sp. TLI_171]|uniref:DUF4240 domain-containing protein n=1 Tax=Streptomyces sp. TLI_171 TaxID=1938859 RepID=UPI000C1821CB|nr:DUF4240 domain-containing protein [Streptomyces sp. TLI_171]RKE17703.1 uncharacterized protein DUF4240 [Streptomyces sp. TLI_171]